MSRFRYLGEANILGKPGGQWHTVIAPAGWTWSLPLTIKQNGRNFQVSGWTIDQSRPTGKKYYVSMTGNDANDGLAVDDAHALRKVSTAIAKPDVDEIYIKTGYYGLTNGWTGIGNPARSMSIIALGGRVQLGTFAEGLTWTADGNAYKCTRSNVLKVADITQSDVNGDYTFLTLVADSDTCKATPGSWYTDNVTVWVRTIDSRLPTYTVRCFFSNVALAGKCTTASVTLYMENIDFEGGVSGSVFSLSGASQTDYLNNCTFKYASPNGNGLLINNSITAYLKDCIASANTLDGFNYTSGAGGSPSVCEINCTGRNNGTAGDVSDNGSTCHAATKMVRIMGNYYSCVGRCVHDVGTGQSWLLGSYSRLSAASPQLANFGCGTGVLDTRTMWLDCCRSSGSVEDIEVVIGCTVNIRNFIGDAVNSGAGTIQTY